MFKTIVFLPLVGFLIAGIFGRQIGTRASQVVTSGLLVISAILSISAFIDVAIGGNNYTVHVANWVSSGSLEFNWALKIDTLTAVMLVVVTLVSAIVHIYSVGYMSHDPHNPRFFAYLSLFTFAMLMLVTADSFLQMFFYKCTAQHSAVVYHLLSIANNQRMRLRVYPENNDFPVINSVVAIWSGADWFEREAFDLFGIVFEGHPDLRRILSDYGFIGHPFRKEYPLSGHVEMRYDAEKGRVIYQPVSIEPRVLVPRVIRDDHRYKNDQTGEESSDA